MRKFTFSFSLLLMFIFSLGASAQWANLYIEDIADDPVESLDDIDPDAYYVVFNTGRNAYWNECQVETQTAHRTVPKYGMSHVTDVVNNPATAAFKFVINGDGTVSIQAASGRWVPLPEMSTQAVTETSAAHITCDVADEGSYFHFTDGGSIEINGNADNVVGWTSGNGANGKMHVFLVQLGEETCEMKLERVLNEINWDESNWPVGDTPGYYPQELVDGVIDAYDTATEAQISGDENEMCDAADALLEAYTALVNGQIPVTVAEGFYYLVNARDTTSGNVIEDLDAVTDLDGAYADGSKVYWETHLNTKAGVEEAEPQYMWEVKAATDSTFTIRNFGYDAYMGNVTANSTPYTLVKDVADAAQFQIGTSDVPGGFVFIRNNEVANGLHAASSNQAVVNWNVKGSFASAWKLVTVPEDVLAGMGEKCQELRKQFAQKALNDTLSKYFDLAKAAQAAGKSYISSATYDGAMPVDSGLVTSVDQVFSNARETSEGSYEGLFDGDYTTFFHTAWGNSEFDVTEDHYLQLDLGEKVQTLVMKYAERSNAQTPDVPCYVNIFATNDASLLSSAPDGEDPILVPSEQWDSLGQFTFTWQYAPLNDEGGAVGVSYSSVNEPVMKGAGLFSIEMPKAYQYIRLSVYRNFYEVKNNSHGRVFDGHTYWNLSELRVYKAEYDPDCVYAHMDPAVIGQLESSLVTAEGEIAAGKATEATINALKEAYEAYMSVFPDKTKLNEKIADLKTFAEKAVEGEDPGYFEAGAVAELNDAIADAEAVAAGTLLFETYNKTMKDLDDAYAAFNAKLILPEDGIYYIMSQSGADQEERADNSPFASYVYAQSTSTHRDVNAGLRWGYQDESDIQYHADAVWILKRGEGNTVTLKNVYTGLYMGNDQENLSSFVFNSAEPANIGLRFARYEGTFNLVLNDKYFANTQPSKTDRRLVTWTSANGADNSAFVFVPATYEGQVVFDIKGTDATVFTMPFDAEISEDAYTVVGKREHEKGANVELAKITGTIPAGTPFVVYPADAVVTSVEVYFKADQYDAISYVTEPVAAANGLVGVLQPDTVTADALVWRGDSLVAAETPTMQAIAANRGYISYKDLPVVTEAGAASLPIAGAVVQGIETISLENGKVAGRKAGIFNLQGVRLNSDKNLPKGIYIINGKKVVRK
jgi:hypothetical protein